jgi:hypothetical protein
MRVTHMDSKKSWNRVPGVLAALALALAVQSCGKDDDNSGSPSSPGAGVNTPLLWTSTAVGGTGANTTQDPNGDTPLLWVDPNTYPNYIPTGIGGIIRYSDVRTYGGPNMYADLTSPYNVHPLRTTTTSNTIVVPEDTLAGRINAYRQTTLGNINVGGGGGFGGGGVIGGNSGILLPMHSTAREASRAHCHHYANLIPFVPLPALNEEGDLYGNITNVYPANNPGTPAMATYDRGRLGKNGIRIGQASPFNWTDTVFSGSQWNSSDAVYSEMIANYYIYVIDVWTAIAVGHWIGGTEAYYWEVNFLFNPDPAY